MGVYQDITEIKMLKKGKVKSVPGQVVHTIRTYLSFHSIKFLMCSFLLVVKDLFVSPM